MNIVILAHLFSNCIKPSPYKTCDMLIICLYKVYKKGHNKLKRFKRNITNGTKANNNINRKDSV